MRVKLIVNDELHEVDVPPYRTLNEVLRKHIGLTGTKWGCGQGECGSCTVLVDGKAALSCLMLAAQAEGKEIVTIEGLADHGRPNYIQQAFIDEGAVQCGFCSPGLIMSAKAFLDENPHPTERRVREAVAGNLCRCTGYAAPIRAILRASRTRKKRRSTDSRKKLLP